MLIWGGLFGKGLNHIIFFFLFKLFFFLKRGAYWIILKEIGI